MGIAGGRAFCHSPPSMDLGYESPDFKDLGEPGMGAFSIWHWLIVLVVVLIFFGGAGKIPRLMRDMGQGVNAFKRGLKEEGKDKTESGAEDKPSIEKDQNAATTESSVNDVHDERRQG